jgi:hypothetical protein
VIARAAGFDHVSDDDFARVTIAQSFAHTPKLDPSGTSWLPFPFWLLGSAMMLLGRSLTTARALSVLFASAAMMLPYVALRRAAKMDRAPSLATVVFAFSTPWAIWSGATTVPESLTASLMTAGVIGLAVPSTEELASNSRRSFLFGSCLMAATLSRYEVWPAALVVAIALLVRSTPATRRTSTLLATLAVAGPLLWMAWNAHAHDGPLHFFRRVSTFKRAIGEGTTSTWEALLLYPRLLITTRPEVTLVTALLLIVMAREKKAWRASGWPVVLAAALAQLLFLSYGNARDGAPAHHPERALLSTFFLLSIFASQAVLSTTTTSRHRQALTAALGLTFAITLARTLSPTLMPATSESEDRKTQVARGESLKSEPHVTLTPCQFEHFALIAAYSHPESVTILPATKEPITSDCPKLAP